MPWSSSAPPAIWPTRRSSRRCRRWSSAAISTCRSSAWPRPAGTSISSGRGRATASRSTAASTRRRSTSCAACCATSTATTTTPRRSRPSARSSAPRSGRRTTSPFRRCCSGRSWSSSAKSGCANGARVIVEKPFGSDLASARKLNGILLGDLRRDGDLPHRPLPREAAGPQHALLPFRQCVPGAVLEPQLRRERADHDGGELRRPGPRRVLRRRPAPSATWSRITCSRCWPTWRWSRRSGPTANRSATKR